METTGTFELTVNGVANASKITCTFSLDNDTAAYTIPYCQFESDSSEFSLSGLPNFLWPTNAKIHDHIIAESDGDYTAISSVMDPANPGVIVLSIPGGWSATGAKGLGFSSKGLIDSSKITYSDTTIRYELSK